MNMPDSYHNVEQFIAAVEATVDVTTEVKNLLNADGTATTIGFLCIQQYPTRICSGCTSACNQSVIFVYEAAP